MAEHAEIPAELDRIARIVVDAAIRVHSEHGPGLLESVYETCLAYELAQRGLKVERQVPLPITYGNVRLEGDLRIDLLVENSVIVEIKAVATMLPVFQAKGLTYLKLPKRRLGLLINFNVKLLKDGLKRLVL